MATSQHKIIKLGTPQTWVRGFVISFALSTALVAIVLALIVKLAGQWLDEYPVIFPILICIITFLVSMYFLFWKQIVPEVNGAPPSYLPQVRSISPREEGWILWFSSPMQYIIEPGRPWLMPGMKLLIAATSERSEFIEITEQTRGKGPEFRGMKVDFKVRLEFEFYIHNTRTYFSLQPGTPEFGMRSCIEEAAREYITTHDDLDVSEGRKLMGCYMYKAAQNFDPDSDNKKIKLNIDLDEFFKNLIDNQGTFEMDPIVFSRWGLTLLSLRVTAAEPVDPKVKQAYSKYRISKLEAESQTILSDTLKKNTKSMMDDLNFSNEDAANNVMLQNERTGVTKLVISERNDRQGGTGGQGNTPDPTGKLYTAILGSSLVGEAQERRRRVAERRERDEEERERRKSEGDSGRGGDRKKKK